ncbi:phosphatidate cytidylyltransferase [Brevibacterium jeotgali]|uniref:Phosphatidate cytidylyltransferase n=1 Tax=Brevibacterium jeotgali TaxID=1262550 RepID=A0A2H1L3I8_9MICO|nr:phosphatidate cytidylyltransferase [Brevibacterium jeotgali]TWC02493.1 phosphatidate cytidylyltransferase [Brevibacterium jeotgali]SMY11285.1 phosphatidate cytidylyltransferase [Brevibacterium jeotgali]
MAETQDAAHADDPPLPSRRELRRIAEEADARGEGPLPQEELLRRAVASRDAPAGASATGGSPEDGARQGAHAASAPVGADTAPAPVGADAAGGPVGAQSATGVAGPTTAGIPIGHGFVTPPSRSGAPAEETPQQTEPTDDGEPKDYGKAGRNLPAAIGVGVVLGGSVLASLIFYPPSFLIIVLVGVCLAMWELAEALSRSGAHVSRIPVIVASACMVLATYVGGREALWVAFTAGAGAVLLFALLERRTGNAVKDVCLSLFALTYVGLMASLIVYLLTLPDGNLLVICFLAVVVASDIGGYIAGVLFGKHPIAPSISPKKSWEGYAGSALLSTAVGVGMAIWTFGAPMWTGIALGVLVPAFATLGDFSESMIKRDLELKDMGSLLPGHGGVMDRLDSILPTAPIALVLFSFLPGFVD